MISAGDFKKGVTFEHEGNVYLVVDFQHVKPGKGGAFVRTKLKNVITGQTIDKTFTPTERFQVAVIERKEMQYLYNEGNLYYFMDLETYDQIPLNKSQIEETLNFITENMVVTILFYKGVAFSITPPIFVELEVVDTEPGLQGDTTKAGTKPAKLETGLILHVPLFINIGDKIRVDTRDGGAYVERVK